jgi:hypothetical protein
MAKNEADREDLIREAAALTERAELQSVSFSEIITVGYRTTGAFSVFIGQDPVYQFDPDYRLRRAYENGFLFRSHETTLARMIRQRTEVQTLLIRSDLLPEELAAFRSKMLNQLQTLLSDLDTGQTSIIRIVPDGLDIIPRLQTTLQNIIGRSDNWLSTPIVKGR